MPTTVPTLEEQLAVLKTAGIELRSGVTITDLLRFEERAAFEDTDEDPYRYLLVLIGEPGGDHEGGRFSHNILHVDVESMEGEGTYIRLAGSMRDLAGGDLPLEQIDEMLERDAGIGWLMFTLRGQAYRWQFELEDDWLDETIFSRFAMLMEQQHTGRRFSYGDLEGQDFLIGYASPEQLELLNRCTCIRFGWLR